MLTKGMICGCGCAIVALCLIVSGCVLSGTPSQVATDAANSTADTVFHSFNTGDYNQFSANLSAPMKAGLNESRFFAMQDQIHSKYGEYLSRSPPQGSVIQGYDNFVYDCSFEKGNLKVRLVMNATEPGIVEGLWFPNGV